MDRKEVIDEKKKKSRHKSGQSSPARSSRASPVTSDASSPKRPRRSDQSSSESTWVSASAMKSPRNLKNEVVDSSTDDAEQFQFDQDDEAQDNFFTISGSGFLRYFERKQFTDCIVITTADKAEYHCHKLILGYSSQFLFDAFKEEESVPADDKRREKGKGLVIGTREEVENGKQNGENLASASEPSMPLEDVDEALVECVGESAEKSVLERREKEVVVVRLEWIDIAEVMPLILHYMYTGQILLTPQNCVLISAVAERLQMPKLQSLCKDYLQASLQRENAVEILLEASKFNAQNLLKRSISNVARNFCHIRPQNVAKLNYSMFVKVLSQEPLIVTDEYTLYQVICYYCELHKETLTKGHILKLMSFIRFRWLSFDQFLEVSQNPIVPKSLLIEAAMARLMNHELPNEEASKRSALLPSRLQQRPKFSILFEYTPPSIASASIGATSNSLASSASHFNSITSSSSSSLLMASSSAPHSLNHSLSSSLGISQSSSSVQMAAVNPMHNPISNQPDLASVLASSFSQQQQQQQQQATSSVASLSSSPLSASSSFLSSSSSSQGVLPPAPQQPIHPDIFRGVIGWIATNSNREAWKNAHVAGRVKVHSSSLAKGSRSTLVDKSPSEVWTNDVPCSWISIDLGPFRKLTLTYYTLRHGLNYKADSVRTWDLQGSNDGISWRTLRRHTNDKSLNAPFACFTWPVPPPVEGYRFFRVMQTGHNSSNHNFLALSGFEFYGWLDVTG
jgi:hypothetical protein